MKISESKRKPVPLLVIPLLFSCASMPVEGIVTDIDSAAWQVGFQRDYGRGHGYLREFVPRGESIQSWTELLSIEFMEGIDTPVVIHAREFADVRQAQCPGTRFSIIESEEYSVTYSFVFPACMGHEQQVEVTRLLQGNDGIHRISYARKGSALDPAIQEYWIARFGTAYVVKGPNREPIH